MNRTEPQRGSFLVSVLVLTVFLTAIALSLSSLIASQYQHTAREAYVANAQLVAEAGIEQSVHQLNIDDSFTGYGSPQTFFNNSTQGKGIFTTTVTTLTDNSKTIVSTGKVYRVGMSQPYITRKVRVTVVGTSSSDYSVHSGPGGLILDGNATITNSNVYVGGTLTLNGDSAIGTYYNPVNVDVANQACPSGADPGSTYPQVCTDGSQPITMDSNTNIFGSVCATGQTDNPGGIQTGDGGAGLEVGCEAPLVEQPTYDRAGQIAAVTTTHDGSDNSYVCNNTWPANLELTGDVTLGNDCNVTITGNVYISGNLSIGGHTTITVDDSLGTTRPVIITDGTIDVNGNISMIANSSGTGIKFISFKNSTGNPAANVTGTDLKNSQSMETISVQGNGNLPGMIFDAYWSKVNMGGNGQMGAAIGQTVELSGNGTVIFGTKLASGSKTWGITSYQQLYD